MLQVILDKTIVSDLMSMSLEGRTLQRILLNEKNQFIISQLLLSHFENNLSNFELDKWKDLFQYLHDNNKLSSITNFNTLNVNDIYNSISSSRNYILILHNKDRIKENYECSLKNTAKENLFFKTLLENNEFTFRYSDFSTNEELNEFFDKILSCSKTNERLILISRYSNFSCPLISLVKEKFDKKNYWTTYKRFDEHCNSNNIAFLKQNLGNQLIVYTGTNEDIHERKIIVDSLLLEFDDDFNKIDVSNKTWKCTCIVDSEITRELRSKQNSLNKFYP